jgi:hypothetical protein
MTRSSSGVRLEGDWTWDTALDDQVALISVPSKSF